MARALATQAYNAVVEGAEEAGVDVDASEAQARKVAQTARAASPAHADGLFVDSLDQEGPRSQP